MIWPWRLGIFW